MKKLIQLHLFLLFKSLSLFSADSIPKLVEKYVIREKLAVEESISDNEWNVYSFSDYNYREDSASLKLMVKANLIVDSLKPYLMRDKSYTLFIKLVNNNTPLLNAFTLVSQIKSGEVVFSHVQEVGKEGKIKTSPLPDNQFIDWKLGFTNGIYANDLFVYNLLDDTLGISDQELYTKAKLLFLAFMNKAETKKYANVHMTFISRIGMHVYRSLIHPMWDSRKTINYYHRLLMWEKLEQLSKGF
jgi:hypothetical protein